MNALLKNPVIAKAVGQYNARMAKCAAPEEPAEQYDDPHGLMRTQQPGSDGPGEKMPFRSQPTKMARRPASGPQSGKAGPLVWHALVFEEASRYGINNGRVSKLEIRRGKTVVARYERGWKLEPKDKAAKKLVGELLGRYSMHPESGKLLGQAAKFASGAAETLQRAPWLNIRKLDAITPEEAAEILKAAQKFDQLVHAKLF